jgi:hypothetical protein
VEFGGKIPRHDASAVTAAITAPYSLAHAGDLSITLDNPRLSATHVYT